MLENKKLIFIGGGNMAQALIEGLIGSKKMLAHSIRFTEILAQRREYLTHKLGVQSFSNNLEGVSWADIVLFAVKPQNINTVLAELKPLSLANKLFISIAAGVPIRRFEEMLGQNVHVIRTMPNMPALVRKGISGISRGSFAASDDENLAVQIMSAVGEVVQLPENLLDALTAISGSGPAYFFYFMEALFEAGIELGLDPQVSSKLVECTALGAGHLIQSTQEKAEVLRKKVTSPGGTTEAAIRVFEENHLKDILIKAVHAAEKRSKELQKGS